ncbi:ABC transporter permease subunit (plasmid) [Rhizobium sp. B230/85]|uniref:ABC transporter permease n=1 Tax=unclassified Rhizobium TaxID=2613769 RepID=UPI001ADAE203|nr:MULTISPECIES: ABC transporter permease subunit [unclassified Rhizobium]MBO9136662.1 ABC transporter permease subunit [Rhizobium sp. B209b/85]QXZ99789.1 ABC transporter permease subunit [Rhizobium sp. B230/85]
MDIALLLSSTIALTSGIPLTLLLTSLSLAAAFVVSVPLAFMRASAWKWFSMPVLAYTYMIRGTPLLVQLFLIYYGPGQIEFIRSSPLWLILRDPFRCCLLAFSLNSAAYTTEIFRGGIQAVTVGMVEAAEAIGMTPMQVKCRIVFPIAFRSVLPSYANEVIGMLKASSLASTVTLLEITGLSRKLVAETFAPYEVFIAAGILYLCLTFILTSTFQALESLLTGAPQTNASPRRGPLKEVRYEP